MAAATPAALAQEDPANVVFSAEFEDGKIIKSDRTALGKESFGRAALKPKDVKEDRLPPESKIQPALENLIAGGGDPGKPIEVVVNYRDPLTVPTFPMPVLDEDRDSARNKELLEQARGMVEDLKARRAELYKQQTRRPRAPRRQGAQHLLADPGRPRQPAARGRREAGLRRRRVPRARGRRRRAAGRRQQRQRSRRRAGPDLLGPVLQPRPDVGLDRPARHRRARDAHRLQRPRPHRDRRRPDRRRRPVRPVQPRHGVGRRDHGQRQPRQQLARRLGDLARLVGRLRQRLPRRLRAHRRRLPGGRELARPRDRGRDPAQRR